MTKLKVRMHALPCLQDTVLSASEIHMAFDLSSLVNES